jgi:hypothetical protein
MEFSLGKGGGKIDWRRDPGGLRMDIPTGAKGEHAFVWKLTLGEANKAAPAQPLLE